MIEAEFGAATTAADNKLIQFNGDYLQAEMVKAFLTSLEYRKRLGP